MTCDLVETLRLHSLWLQDDPAGVRANLRDADLCDANLRGADLHGANLRDANLNGADLHGANLRYANLRGANLRGANLRDADLRDANLNGADLHGANLRDAQGVPIAEDAPARLQAVAAAVLAEPEALQMDHWHSDCGTAHCLAGMAIQQAGPLGAVLEQLHGPALAGLLLLGSEAAQHFYDSNEAALEWLRSISTTTQERTDESDD